MKKKLLLLIIILLLTGIFSSCLLEEITISDTRFALDTVVEIKLYYELEQQVQEDLIDEAFVLIDELNDKLNVYDASSELYKIRENAGIAPVDVSNITYSVISDSIYYSELTNGLFDISSGPLIDLWAIDPPNGYVPSSNEMDDALDLIDYNKIDLSQYNQVYLENEAMVLNLGAIAKGRIADEVKDFLVDNRVYSSYINLGGNVLTIGNKIDGTAFAVGVQDPFDLRGTYLMSVSISDQAIVTSGDYERYFEYEGKIYHHILDTQTGYPAETNIKQVTVIAPTSQIADALSTSLLLVGIEEGLKIVNSIHGVEVIFITKDYNVYFTEGLDDKIIFEEKPMANFTVVVNPEELY